WSLLTLGADTTDPIVGAQSAGPRTAIEVLTTNDDNADLTDGTPNYAVIVPAFRKHNIVSPIVQLMTFSYPPVGTPPTLLSALQPTTIQVVVNPVHATPLVGDANHP